MIDYVPGGRWESLTMLSALAQEGTTAAMTFEGGTDVMAMLTFVEAILAALLNAGKIVVMDNLSSHKDENVLAAIEATGAQLEFLPRYSPDLNPIEAMWSKVKAFLRKTKARTMEALIEAIGDALRTVTGTDAMGWFIDCGYAQTQT